LDIQLQQLVHL